MTELINLMCRIGGFSLLALAAFIVPADPELQSVSFGVVAIGLLVGSQRWR